MNTNIIKTIRETKGYTKKYLCEQIGMTTNGFDHAINKMTLKVRDLEKIADVLAVPIGVFFNENNVHSFINEGDNSPISIGSSVSQKGVFGKNNQLGADNETLLLQEKNKGLEREIEGLKTQLNLKDEIIGILKDR